MLAKLRQYWKPRSVAFWSGASLMVSGLLEATGGSIPGVSEWARPVIDAYFGTSGPVVKLSLGMGLIGIRRAQDDA